MSGGGPSTCAAAKRGACACTGACWKTKLRKPVEFHFEHMRSESSDQVMRQLLAELLAELRAIHQELKRLLR